jgi:hypothetical protein
MEVKNKIYSSKDQMRGGFFETATDNESIFMDNFHIENKEIND